MKQLTRSYDLGLELDQPVVKKDKRRRSMRPNLKKSQRRGKRRRWKWLSSNDKTG